MTQGGWKAADERPLSPDTLDATVVTIEGEYAFRFTKLAGEWTRAAALEQGNEQWAEAWSALETLRGEAEGLDMDPRHALARAASVLDRAGASRR